MAKYHDRINFNIVLIKKRLCRKTSRPELESKQPTLVLFFRFHSFTPIESTLTLAWKLITWLLSCKKFTFFHVKLISSQLLQTELSWHRESFSANFHSIVHNTYHTRIKNMTNWMQLCYSFLKKTEFMIYVQALILVFLHI